MSFFERVLPLVIVLALVVFSPVLMAVIILYGITQLIIAPFFAATVYLNFRV